MLISLPRQRTPIDGVSGSQFEHGGGDQLNQAEEPALCHLRVVNLKTTPTLDGVGHLGLTCRALEPNGGSVDALCLHLTIVSATVPF